MKRIFTFIFLLTMMCSFQSKATIHIVQVGNFFYMPANLTINLGDTVRFQWQAGNHPTASDSAAWATFPMDAGNTSFDLILNAAGNYPYHCTFHGGPGVGMAGSITVNLPPPMPPAAIVITEIMYNPPESGTDSLEYIELFNAGMTPVDLANFSFSQGVNHTFASLMLNPGQIAVVAGNANAVQNFFGITGVIQWTSGGLSNGGEDIALVDAMGQTVDSVNYDDNNPWPNAADGNGPSLELLDPTFDNLDPINWLASTTIAGNNAAGMAVFGTPGMLTPNNFPGSPHYPIALVHTEDAMGVADSLGVQCQITGTVVGIDFDGNNGISFTILDATGGMNIFNFNDVSSYVVAEGDLINCHGTIAQFNGLTELIPDSIVLISQGNPIPNPVLVTTLDETTESDLIELNGFTLVNPANWPAAGAFSTNLDITNGTDTLTMRIDSDTDIPGMAAPVGTFDVVGIGGQFDNSAPHDDGYQILPSRYSDITFTAPPANNFPGVPHYDIATIHTEDAMGVADSLGVLCQITGTVVGIDLDGNAGILFTLVDATGGISIFNFVDVSAYVVAEGDELNMRGTVGQFNGLTQLVPDSIIVNSNGNPIPNPTVVTTLDETTESNLLRLNGFSLVNPANWPTAGNNQNLDITNGTDTLVMRIDRDTDIDGMPAPMGMFDVIGIGGQFDGSAPHDEGYQILPSRFTDIIPAAGGNNFPGVPHYDIATIHTEDAMGVADSLGVLCQITGTVIGIDLDGNAGILFTLVDATGGISIFNFVDVSAYVVAEGDELNMRGTVGQFNGLTQLVPDSIIVNSNGNPIPNPTVVTALDETTESNLLRLNGFSLVNPANWPTAGNNQNLDITNGTDTLVMRIDRDTDIDGMPAPMGMFDVIGIGGQFDGSAPHDEGYQILPSRFTDIIPAAGGNNFPGVPHYDIATIHTEDAMGVADSLGVVCQITGTVVGIDLDGNAGISFTLVDSTGGINIFNFNDVSSYVVAEGDELNMRGTVGQFRGLTQLTPDSIIVLSAANPIPNPIVVTALDETTESTLVRLNGFTLINPAAWPTGGSVNLDITNGTDTLTMRIDGDTNIPGTPAPTGMFDLIGIGGQFDSSAPFDDGYQIFPRYLSDIILPAPSGINFAMASNTVAENAGTVNVDLNITNPSMNNETIAILVSNGAGITAGDYTTNPAAINDTINLNVTAGSALATFAINVIDDMDNEATESINFEIVQASGTIMIGPMNTYGFSITDNDSVPPPPVVPYYPIAIVHTEDSLGVADSLNVNCILTGTVLGLDLRGGTGLSFTIVDFTGGMNVFDFNDVSGYAVNEGDSIWVRGNIIQFRGLTELQPDSIRIIGPASFIPNPTIVTTMNESTESNLIGFDNITLLDPSLWPGVGSGSVNLDFDTGTDTLQMRIDSDSDVDGTPTPNGTFSIRGIGGQFDSTSPFTEGYQIFPHHPYQIIAANHSLIAPANGANIKVEGDPTDMITANWTASTEQDGGAVAYTFLLDDLAGDFSNPILSLSSNSGGVDTFINFSVDALTQVLSAAGLNIGDTLFAKWTVRATNTLYSGLAPEYTINLEKGMVTSIDEKTLENAVQLFPNPTQGLLNIQFKENNQNPYQVLVYDLNGKVLMNKNELLGNQQLDISELSNGIYLVKVLQNDAVKIERISVVK